MPELNIGPRRGRPKRLHYSEAPSGVTPHQAFCGQLIVHGSRWSSHWAEVDCGLCIKRRGKVKA